jgi:cytochrome P450
LRGADLERSVVTEAPPLADEITAYASLEPAALADRWRIYRRLREESPVHEVGGSVLITTHEDVCRVLGDHARVHNGAPSRGVSEAVLGRLTRAERALLDDIVDWEERWLTAANGARHDELRALGTRVFAARAIAEMRDRVAEVVDELLTELAARSAVDFVTEFAYRLPLTVISEILDIPDELRGPLHEAWVGMMPARTGLAWRSNLPRDLEDAHRHFKAMERLVKELLDLRSSGPTTEIMRNIVEARSAGADEKDLLVLIQILVSAGHQTTQDLVAGGLHALLTERDQWRRLCEEPSRAADADEEILRYRSPSQDIERFAAAPFELRGVHVPRGRHITVLLGSANRDPAVFRDPDVFDIGRSDARSHVAFGRGPHYCLGAALSRMEGTLALEALARRFPDAELLDEEPQWIASTHLLGLSVLQVSLTPAAQG